MVSGFLPALVLSTAAGLSTAIGSLIALFTRRSDTKFLSFSLGFSAGVMVLVSFAELMPESSENLAVSSGRAAGLAAAAAMAAGILLAALIDRLVPSFDGGTVQAGSGGAAAQAAQMKRMGIVAALAITIHNFPEGIATFMAGYSNLRLGLPVALSIAMHNIPEGVAVSVPFFYGTGSKLKAFSYSALSGLSEPLGALAAYLVLAPLMCAPVLGTIFGMVAGIMVYMSFAELIPASERYGHSGWALSGIFTGISAMWCALRFFGL